VYILQRSVIWHFWIKAWLIPFCVCITICSWLERRIHVLGGSRMWGGAAFCEVSSIGVPLHHPCLRVVAMIMMVIVFVVMMMVSMLFTLIIMVVIDISTLHLLLMFLTSFSFSPSPQKYFNWYSLAYSLTSTSNWKKWFNSSIFTMYAICAFDNVSSIFWMWLRFVENNVFPVQWT